MNGSDDTDRCTFPMCQRSATVRLTEDGETSGACHICADDYLARMVREGKR